MPGKLEAALAELRAERDADVSAGMAANRIDNSGSWPCCYGSKQGPWHWIRRVFGSAPHSYEVVRAGGAFAVARRSRKDQWHSGRDRDLMCSCGKWTPSHMEDRGCYGYQFDQRFYHDARDAQAVADKLSKGIPLSWPLWAAVGFALLQVIELGLLILLRFEAG